MTLMKIKEQAIDDFCSNWKESIGKLESTPMPSSLVNVILDTWLTDYKDLNRLIFSYATEEKGDTAEFMKDIDLVNRRLVSVRCKLNVAAAISMAKWKDKHPGILDGLLPVQIKNLNLGINVPAPQLK